MSTGGNQSAAGGLDTGRVETLVDGVFAIAMTLLVLDIRVPVTQASQLPHKLLDLGPNLLSYALSFVVLGVYWVGHHNQYHFIRRTDRTFLWINVFFLLLIAFIPFSAALLAQYSSDRLAVAIYGANLVAVGLLLELHWWYAVTGHRLTDAVPPGTVRLATRRILTGPVVYVIAIALSLVSTRGSIALYVLVPLLYIVPGQIDRHWIGERVDALETALQGGERHDAAP